VDRCDRSSRIERREDSVERDEVVIVLTTVGVDVNAGAIASALVDERLAACVNVLPEMTSYFRWLGAVEQAEERQLVIKTTSAQLPALEHRLHELHPYELPEFLVVPARQASEAYLKWVVGSTGVEEAGDGVKH
jgi:periplasmic divalent cation tolerance protein